jgi:AcrR family transcriptional regulator
MSLREEQKNLTRNRLLDAAVAVLVEKSVVDATMEDIAKAAGVTRVTVYTHFPGKAEIVRALAERVYGLMDQVFADLAAVPRLTRSEIRTWLDSATARWQEMAPILGVVRSASAMVARDSATSRDRYLGAQERYVAMLIEDPERWRDVPPAQARQWAFMAVLQTESFLSAWVVAGYPLETDDPLDLLADTLCHILRPALENDARRS